MWFDETKLPWVLPSPNIPTPETTVVYPGAVMFEGTNISEGRGTTKPFEMIGAPYIDPYELKDTILNDNLPGVFFRPLHFQPTFHKYSGEICGGLQIHVLDREAFKPVLTSISIASAIHRLYPNHFEWKQPPYEYVYDKLPFDVINGGSVIREQIEAGTSVLQIEDGWRSGLSDFAKLRKKYLLYE